MLAEHEMTELEKADIVELVLGGAHQCSWCGRWKHVDELEYAHDGSWYCGDNDYSTCCEIGGRNLGLDERDEY
jgi:hypothetical protein